MINSRKLKKIFPLFILFLLVGVLIWGFRFQSQDGSQKEGPVKNYQNKPEENRFTKITLAENLDEPVELAILPDGGILFVERKGNVRIYDAGTKKLKLAGTIPVSTKYESGKQAEDGLLGVQLDPNFKKNNWIYFYYAPAGDDPKYVLARYELRDQNLIGESRKIMLEVPAQRQECCHTGGSIEFDAKGNLYVSTGDNTNPHASGGYSPSDERPERGPWDAQKSSANTNDLRGKILRIHPEPDGSYTIPEGNLFPKGTPKTRPEIYTMGHRNPYRISIDSKTGFLYWGDVGPDASKDSSIRGPRGYDEIGQARAAGNFGWPYFIGDNKAYNEFDFATKTSGPKYKAEAPVNNSPNNTGLEKLPPAKKAFIWYPYANSEEFSKVGSGGRTAMAGPVFYKDDFKNAARAFPDYYDGKLFIYEWMRGWIMVVTMDKKSNYVSMEKFMPSHRFSNPMDMAFSPDGDLYLLEYGTSWFMGNEDARLVKIEYNGGNRKPLVKINVNKKKGDVPFDVKFSSKGTEDFDNDQLTYEWKIESGGKIVKTFTTPNPTVTFSEPGIYRASLTVTDAQGAKSEETLEIHAGNEPPVVTVNITKGNKTFFFPGESISYSVEVVDKEDGSLSKGKISPQSVPVTIDYLEQGYDKIQIAQGHQSADESTEVVEGQKLIEASDCKACHNIEKKSIGPAYKAVAEKYKGQPEEADRLAKKIINGGSGVWGEVAMSAHPSISTEDAKEMIKYILSLGEEKKVEILPASGTYTTNLPEDDKGEGVFIIRASYTDKGAKGIPPTTTEEILNLRSSTVYAHSADKFNRTDKFQLNTPKLQLILAKANSNIVFKNVDLTGIKQLTFKVAAPTERIHAIGGSIEVRIDSETGPLIGKSSFIEAAEGSLRSVGRRYPVVKLDPVNGTHDLFFIFKGKETGKEHSLFALYSVDFQNTDQVKVTHDN